MNCWLLPDRGSFERLHRSVALSASVSRCFGLRSSVRWPVLGSVARVSNESIFSSVGLAAGLGDERPRGDRAGIDLVLEPGAIEAIVVRDFADKREDGVRRDRGADAG